MRIILAFRAFFNTLFNAAVAREVQTALERPALPAPAEKATPKPSPTPAAPAKPARSEAITLLAALQREARFIDLVQETLDQYSDDQVGAAARDVLRDCRVVVKRMFDLRPVVDDQEGAAVEIPEGFESGTYRLTGNIAGQPPFSGKLVHHGWQAGKCDVPTWNGEKSSALVVAAAEVEIA